MGWPDTRFDEIFDCLADRWIIRNLQGIPQVFFVISGIDNEHRYHFTVNVAHRGKAIRISWEASVYGVEKCIWIIIWIMLPDFIFVEYVTLEEVGWEQSVNASWTRETLLGTMHRSHC